MNLNAALLLSIPAAALLAAAALGYGNGAFPGTTGIGGTVPAGAARQVASCGQCHRTFPGGLGLRVTTTPAHYVLAPSQSIAVTTRSTGGQTHPMDWGGFLAESTGGTLTAGSNSHVDPSGRFVTHTLASISNGRVWTYGFTAPATPGLVEIYSVVNTVNGDGRPGGEDFWGFSGFSSAATQGTPVRLYVNATGVQALGEPCVGRFGSHPVLGALTPATRGSSLQLELHGAMPAAATTILMGANPAFTPLDLSVIGVTGCTLQVDLLVPFAATTGAGDLLRAEGQLSFPLPIPANPFLAGLQLQFQAVILEPSNGRPLPLTLTNGLAVTVQ